MNNNYEAMLADEFSRKMEFGDEPQAEFEQPANPIAPPQEGVQVAMMGGLKNALGQIRKINKPSTEQILDNVANPPENIMSPQAINDLEQMLTKETDKTDELEGTIPIATTPPVDTKQVSPFFEHKKLSNEDILKAAQSGADPTEKLTAQRSYNIERHHEGAIAAINATFDQMQDAREFARVLDSIANETGKKGSLTFDRIRSEVGTEKDIFRELEPVFKGTQSGLLTAKQNYAARVLASSLFMHMKKTSKAIGDGDDSTEALTALARTTEQLNFVVQYVANNASETGRALGAHRMIAQSTKLGSLEKMSAVLDSIGGVEDVKAQANLINTLNDVEELTGQSASAAYVGSLWRKFNLGTSAAAEYWRAQILTSAKTHIVNVGSSMMQLGWDSTVRGVAAGIGEGRKKIGGLTGKEVNDYVSKEEALAQLSSGFNTIGDSWRMATRAFKQNEGRFTKNTKGDEDNKGDFNMIAVDVGKLIFGEGKGEQIGQTASDVLLGAYRMLGAEDELGKAIGYRRELSAQAVRQAIKEGLEGDAMWSRAGQLIEMPTPEIHKVAMDGARRVTFQDEFHQGAVLTNFVQATKSAVHHIPALGFVIPFIETPTNIGRRLVEMSPMFIGSKQWRDDFAAGGARRDVANAKAVMALGLSVAAWQMYDSGMLTGSGPEKWGVQEQLRKEGWQPNSLYVGDTHYAIDRMSPFGQALMGITAYLDQAHYAGEEAELLEAFATSTMYIAQNLTELPFAQGFNDLLDFANGDSNALPNMVKRIPSGFVPFSSLVKDAKDVIDPVERTISQDTANQSGYWDAAWQHTKSRLPMVSKTMRPKRYWDGEVIIPDAGRVAYAVSPVRTNSTDGKDDPINMALLDNGFVPAEANPLVSYRGVEFSLVELDSGRGEIYDKYIVRLGDERVKAYGDVIKRSEFKKGEPKGENTKQFEYLKKAENKAQQKALIDFIEKDLGKLLNESPSLSAIGNEINDKRTLRAWTDEIKNTYSRRKEDNPDFTKSVRLRGKDRMLSPNEIELNPLR